MEEAGWRIRWSMALRPDASMLPGRSVFLQAAGRVSLTATEGDAPGLLPGMWEEFPLDECVCDTGTMVIDTQKMQSRNRKAS